MKKKIEYFECDEEGTFAIHATVYPEGGQAFHSMSVSEIIAKTTDLVTGIARLREPSITYAYDGRIMFIIKVSVEYIAGDKSIGFAIMRAMENDGWVLEQHNFLR